MGLAASQAKLLFLTAYKSDLEFRMQSICAQRMGQAMASSSIAQNLSTEYSAMATDTSDASKTQHQRNVDAINAKLQYIQSIDKQLELEQKQIETQHKAAETEVESVKKVIDKNIESSFKAFV